MIDIAKDLHPPPNFARLAELLPSQLELGIPPDLLGTNAGNALGRSDYVNVLNKNLDTPRPCSPAPTRNCCSVWAAVAPRLRVLREVAEHATSMQATPGFADVLPVAND